MAAVVGAIGLTILTGAAGQLSLAHAFFLAVGAYSYSYYAGVKDPSGASKAHGLGMPPVLAMILAVATAGVVGLLFSPIAGRLRGIYLGVASLSLVFIGSFIYENARGLTGGFNGRPATEFDLFGFHFGQDNPPLTVLNVVFGRFERLWYLFLALAVLAYIFGVNVLRGRMGRAMQTMRDSEVAAATMGVDIRRTKAGVFALSSMYAGLAGVMVALAFTRVTPDYFILPLSISYLAMVVIGGLGSVGGAALGAVFVTALPTLLSRYSGSLPFVAEPASGGYDAGKISAALFGVAIVFIVIFEPGGLSALGTRITRRFRRSKTEGPATEPKRAMPRSGTVTRTQEDPV
ncbi:MAG: branched-chain amino acid ABC transporter permease [Pseudonocardiales bacterium]|nr:MAG: branched-chain amino acid ABC transporter permease [Pseudonocardiales bacterium]